MTQAEQYRAQALAAESAAEDAVLDNVRDRSLRSAKAWHEMANRAERSDRLRAERAPPYQSPTDAENDDQPGAVQPSASSSATV